MTQLPDGLINFVNTKWHRAHKLAMFVHYMKANEPEKAMTQQLLYLAACDEENEYWCGMDDEGRSPHIYWDYLRLIETIHGG